MKVWRRSGSVCVRVGPVPVAAGWWWIGLSSVFVCQQHHVGEQPGPAHRAVGPHGAHPLHQQLTGDGRLQHHHHRLPWRSDLPVGHDAWAAGGSGGLLPVALSLFYFDFIYLNVLIFLKIFSLVERFCYLFFLSFCVFFKIFSILVIFISYPFFLFFLN